MKFIFFLLTVIATQRAYGMKPYRPDMMAFYDASKDAFRAKADTPESFPWISAVHLTADTLFIWICDQMEASISLKDHSVKTSQSKPVWLSESGTSKNDDILFTPEAKKQLWDRKRD